MMTILFALLIFLVHGFAAKGSDKSQRAWLSAAIRTGPILPGQTDGNLLKVLPGGSLQARNVSFTGPDPSDPKTVFHLEKSNAKLANALRYREGKNDYYLCAESGGKVLLRKSNVFPSQNKYFFNVRNVNRFSRYMNFKSLDTGEYLLADRSGRVSMGTVPSSTIIDGQPQDRRTWFAIYMNLV